MKRLGSIDEVIKSVAYLLSDDSSYTTGTNLVIDGGLSSGLKAWYYHNRDTLLPDGLQMKCSAVASRKSFQLNLFIEHYDSSGLIYDVFFLVLRQIQQLNLPPTGHRMGYQTLENQIHQTQTSQSSW